MGFRLTPDRPTDNESGGPSLYPVYLEVLENSVGEEAAVVVGYVEELDPDAVDQSLTIPVEGGEPHLPGRYGKKGPAFRRLEDETEGVGELRFLPGADERTFKAYVQCLAEDVTVGGEKHHWPFDLSSRLSPVLGFHI